MIYLFLLSLWPLFNYINVNYDKINNLRDIAIIAGSLLVMNLGAIFIVKKIVKKDTTALLLPVWFFLIVVFFSYGPVIDSLGFSNQPYIKYLMCG